MSLATRVLLALVAGLAVGMLIAGSHDPGVLAIPRYVEPLGALWVNSLRMTVVPLVVSSIVIGVNSLPDGRDIGRIGSRALALALLILFIAATFGAVLGRFAMSFLTIDAAASAALRASAATATDTAVQGAQKMAGIQQWIVDLVPINPLKAMAEGTMLPVIVFTLVFGLAITRIADDGRTALLRGMRGVYDASLTIMRWVMVLAPIGVFALAIPLAQRLGLAAAGVVLFYVAVVLALCGSFILVLYLAAWLVGGKDLGTFVRACAPAQAVALSARSSLVTLPAMLEAADAVLHLPVAVRSFYLPLAAATFKCGSAVMIPIGVLFVARLYGVDVGAAQLVTIALMTVATTFSVPSVPGGTIIVIVPVLVAAGIPVAAVGLLLSVDTIPDMIRTATHATAQMSSATILARFEAEAPGV